MQHIEDLSRQMIDSYKLIEVVGEGSYGTVYRAYDNTSNQIVAFKLIKAEILQVVDAKRIEREITVLKKLTHENIAHIIDHDQYMDRPYIVLQWLDGGNLHQKLGRGPLHPKEVLHILNDIRHALVFAHSKGIIHRDLKPANIMFDQSSNQYFLTDFGVAKDLGALESLTRTGLFVGTASYASPEQLEGNKITQQSDIYGLGMVLFELLAGYPYPDNPLRHWREGLPPLDERRPGLSNASDIDRVLQKATARHVSERYVNIWHLHDDFANIFDQVIEPQDTDTGQIPSAEADTEKRPSGRTINTKLYNESVENMTINFNDDE